MRIHPHIHTYSSGAHEPLHLTPKQEATTCPRDQPPAVYTGSLGEYEDTDLDANADAGAATGPERHDAAADGPACHVDGLQQQQQQQQQRPLLSFIFGHGNPSKQHTVTADPLAPQAEATTADAECDDREAKEPSRYATSYHSTS